MLPGLAGGSADVVGASGGSGGNTSGGGSSAGNALADEALNAIWCSHVIIELTQGLALVTLCGKKGAGEP